MRLEPLVVLLLGTGCSMGPDVLDGADWDVGDETTEAGSTSLGGTSVGTGTDATSTTGATDTDPDDASTGTTGDTGDPEPLPPPDECWSISTLVDDPEQSPARGLTALDDALVLAGAPSYDGVGAIALDGAPLWSYGRFSPPELPLQLHEAAPRGDGSFLLAGQRFAPANASNESLWIGQLGVDGALAWEREVGSIHYMVWVDIDVRTHPMGGFVVSGHDSLADGSSPRLLTIRLDDAGQTVWSQEHPLPGEPPIAINWSMGAMDLLPSGDVVQLTAATEGVRVLRTTADGDLAWDQTYATATWPQDVVALPDGDLLVLSRDLDDAVLQRLDGDGVVEWERRHHYGPETNLSAMAWDPLSERLLAWGGTRGLDGDPEPMGERTFAAVFDGDGDMHWWNVGEPGSDTLALDLVRDATTTRFYATTHGKGLRVYAIETCLE